MIRSAEGYALERVNNAGGETARFVAMYEEYRKAPEVTRQRLYLEALQRVLPNTGDKLVVDGEMKNLVPLLDMKGGQSLPRPQGGGQ